MKPNFGCGWAIGLGIAILTSSFSPIIASAAQGGATSENCSLAIFSQPAVKAEHICDERTVRNLARHGQVFEQNQLGIASILGIAAGSDAKDALKWFEEAAHKGYAPAQVNLAVMYSNGWGQHPTMPLHCIGCRLPPSRAMVALTTTSASCTWRVRA